MSKEPMITSIEELEDIGELLNARDTTNEKQLIEALKNICRHMKMMLPDNYEMSAAWNIANRAIKEYEDDK